jgi:putative addiction module component (TIGR02574 family)
MDDPHTDIDFSRLSPAERILLAQDLWDSVLSADPDVVTTEEHRIEIERRIAAADAGLMKSRPWREIRDQWRRKE